MCDAVWGTGSSASGLEGSGSGTVSGAEYVLTSLEDSCHHSEDTRFSFPTVVSTTKKRNGRGRPRKHIDPTFLRDAMAAGRGIKVSELAPLIGVHRNTLSAHLKREGLQPRYSSMNDLELEGLVKIFKVQKPASGLRYLMGFLRNRGIRVQRRRVVGAMRRVDVLGQKLRKRKIIQRRKYHVPRPNSVWHIDGHHKMIRWGIVFHAIVDGYCRTVSRHSVFPVSR